MKQVFVDTRKCLACRTCEIRCAIERNSSSQRLAGASREIPPPIPRVYVAQIGNGTAAFQCRHCTDAPCIEACPTSAMKREPETNIVYVQETDCIGCFMCVMVCPFAVVSPDLTAQLAVKCDQCRGRSEPVCVESCPTGALSLCGSASLNDWKKERVESLLWRLQELLQT